MQTNKFLVVAAIAWGVAAPICSFSQTWMQTSAPSNYWVSIAISADGTKLAAAAGSFNVPAVRNGFFSYSVGPIYVSADGGTTWTPTSAPVTNWLSIASSADGTRLIALSYNPNNGHDLIYVSTNSGSTWTQQTSPWGQTSYFAAASATGKFFVDSDQFVFTCTNGSGVWQTDWSPQGSPRLLAVSADGSRLAGSFPVLGNSLMTISNPPDNATWSWTQQTNSPQGPWSAITSSADGSVLIGAMNGGDYSSNPSPIYLSTNFGVNWMLTGAPSNDVPWGSVACSADGHKLLAAFLKPFGSPDSPVFVSTNGGLSWITNSLPGAMRVESVPFISSMAMSSDGGMMAATIDGGGIWLARSTEPPRLETWSSSNNLTLSWVIPSTNFVLQQNFDLTTTDWSNVTNTPVLNLTNLQNQVTLPAPGGNAFFRLNTP